MIEEFVRLLARYDEDRIRGLASMLHDPVRFPLCLGLPRVQRVVGVVALGPETLIRLRPFGR